MANITVQTAVQDVKLAAEHLGSVIGLPVKPSAMDFHNLSLRLREFARKADMLAALAIGEASVSSTVEFTADAHFFHDQLDGENVFAGLNAAADEADEREDHSNEWNRGRIRRYYENRL